MARSYNYDKESLKKDFRRQLELQFGRQAEIEFGPHLNGDTLDYSNGMNINEISYFLENHSNINCIILSNSKIMGSDGSESGHIGSILEHKTPFSLDLSNNYMIQPTLYRALMYKDTPVSIVSLKLNQCNITINENLIHYFKDFIINRAMNLTELYLAGNTISKKGVKSMTEEWNKGTFSKIETFDISSCKIDNNDEPDDKAFVRAIKINSAKAKGIEINFCKIDANDTFNSLFETLVTSVKTNHYSLKSLDLTNTSEVYQIISFSNESAITDSVKVTHVGDVYD